MSLESGTIEMTTEDIRRIHERLDDVIKVLSDMQADIREIKVQCKPCRRIVSGNGKNSLETRLTLLESVSQKRTKVFWLSLTGIVALVPILVNFGVNFVVKHLYE